MLSAHAEHTEIDGKAPTARLAMGSFRLKLLRPLDHHQRRLAWVVKALIFQDRED